MTEPSPSIDLENASCAVKLYTFGAHITSFTVDGEEKLWMSSLSKMDGSAPIRGGIPLAFPQFADEGDLPLHGFARDSVWTVVSDETDGHDDDNTTVVLKLSDSERTRKIWPHAFELIYTVRLLERGLRVQLTVKNSATRDGGGGGSFVFAGCFHTYLRFRDTSKVYLSGLDGVTYIDKADGRKEKKAVQFLNVEVQANQSAKEAGIDHGFVDRIYLDSGNEFRFLDRPSEEIGKVLYHVEQSPTFTDTTIYNPWLGDKRGAAGPDFDDDGYKYTICCEPTLAKAHAVTLDGGETWEGFQVITVP